jgi:hypothetical protein
MEPSIVRHAQHAARNIHALVALINRTQLDTAEPHCVKQIYIGLTDAQPKNP